MKKLLILLSFTGISLVSTTSSVIASTIITNADTAIELVDSQKGKKKKKLVTKEKVKINTASPNKQYRGIVKRVNNELATKGYANKLNDKNEDNDVFKSLITKPNSENDYLDFELTTDLHNKKTSLVMNSENLYIEGFVSDGKYFHFKDAAISEYFDKDGDNIDLGYSGNYNDLLGNRDLIITKESLAQAATNLAKFVKGSNSKILQTDLVQMILMTSESMRFFFIRNMIEEVLTTKDAKISWQKDIKPIVTNWEKWTKEYESGENKENARKFISILNRKK